MYKKIIGTALLLLLLAMPAMAEPIRLSISVPAIKTHAMPLATTYLAKLIEERSSGRVQVEQRIRPSNSHYPQGQLETHLMLWPAEQLSNSLPMLKLFDILFLFQDRAQFYQVLNGSLGRQLSRSASKQGHKILTVWDLGFRQLLGTQPLQAPDQLRGRSIEKPSSLLAEMQFSALGAQVIDSSMTAKAADIQELSLPQLQQSMSAVLRHLTLSNHSVNADLLMVSDSFWKSLPRDLQVIIESAISDATRYARELSKQREQQALKQLPANVQVHRLSPQQRENWRNRSEALHAQLLDPETNRVLSALKK